MLTTIALILMLAQLSGAEQFCGWYVNPTPGNHWLVDADGTWTLSTQGGERVPGFDALPETSFDFAGEWRPSFVELGNGDVVAHPSYGRGCACIAAARGEIAGTLRRIDTLEPLPLVRCDADPALPDIE
ncbi:DUF4087 domain-containing protein [Pontivivens ytuae]|uniref:DUF4087 domain-containing protein n=1 Tax=Pontivivens ytuae TaxID=2789856 RepID=A0A7S9QD66_9RHOB|nr:DUF4087 domain-containing protein [Pontivivens ytuae]QPH54560.1 DUF4087 domain-containing protein [Pontivivens ytuae]